MDDTNLQKSLAHLPKERHVEIISHAKNMTGDQRERFLAELTQMGEEEARNMESEGEALGKMESLVTEAEHEIHKTELQERKTAEEQERDKKLDNITSQLDDA